MLESITKDNEYKIVVPLFGTDIGLKNTVESSCKW